MTAGMFYSRLSFGLSKPQTMKTYSCGRDGRNHGNSDRCYTRPVRQSWGPQLSARRCSTHGSFSWRFIFLSFIPTMRLLTGFIFQGATMQRNYTSAVPPGTNSYKQGWKNGQIPLRKLRYFYSQPITCSARF